MKYTKQPLTVEQQISKLKNRKLIINNPSMAGNYLSNISYYRLRAYTYPFQDNEMLENDHKFLRNDISFEDIIDLYCFDRRLRALIFNALEKIEIALRTKIVYEYSVETSNSHWFLDRNLYFNTDKFDYIVEKMRDDVNRSEEDFIKHYQCKYSDPELPPAWMTLETLSLGNLSKLIANLDCKSATFRRISNAFGLPNSFILENWVYALSILRNHCAHHSRIWNRRFHVNIKLPYNTIYPFINRETLKTVRDNKLFACLSCIQYLLNIISPNSDFKNNLVQMIANGSRLIQLKDMGFPKQWQSFEVWNK